MRRSAWCVLCGAALMLAGCSSSSGSDPLKPGGGGGGISGIDNAPGAGIFGRLVNALQKPVAGAKVELQTTPAGRALLAPAVTTDANGLFHLVPTGAVPSSAVVKVTLTGGATATTAVALPPSVPVRLELQLGDDGGLFVVSLAALPADAVRLSESGPPGPSLLPISGGQSAPFTMTSNGTFDVTTRDVALVWREGSGVWHVQRLLAADGNQPILQLGAAAPDLNGHLVEITLLSAAVGRLAGVTTVADPSALGFPVRLAAPTLSAILVSASANRIDAGGLQTDALLYSAALPGSIFLRTPDITALGLTVGGHVRISYNGHVVVATVRGAVGPQFDLLSARVANDVLTALGITFTTNYAGRRLEMVAAP